MTEFMHPEWLARMNEMVYAELAAGMRASAAYLADSMERKRLEQAEREEWRRVAKNNGSATKSNGV